MKQEYAERARRKKGAKRWGEDRTWPLRFGLLLMALSVALSAPPQRALARVAAAPGWVREAVLRGEALRRQWDLDGATAEFEKALALDAANLEATIGLARIAQARFDYATAKQLLDRLAKPYPESAEVLTAYGALYAAAEDTDRALAYFERALAIKRQWGAALIGRAEVALLARDYDGAELRLRQYLTRQTQDADARALLGRVFLEQNETGKAAAEAERSLKSDPYNVDALQVLAFARAVERRKEEVIDLAHRALTLNPLQGGVRRLLAQYLNGNLGYGQAVKPVARDAYQRGQALKARGRLAEAAGEFDAAVKMEPRYYLALIARADIHLAEAEYERAAQVAQTAIAIDGEGSLAHLELSYAHWGKQERARLAIGATDFASAFYRKVAPPPAKLTQQIFPNYSALGHHWQIVVDRVVAPLAEYLPRLLRNGARHYLLPFDQRVIDIAELADIKSDKTFDGRYYASIRGVGGRISVSGIEHIELAARGGYNAIAHEFAHQVHMNALDSADLEAIRKLYQRAKREERTLDYYAAENEYEYFAQGYEAFVSEYKRPGAGITARHTRGELMLRDPELYRYLVRLTAHRAI